MDLRIEGVFTEESLAKILLEREKEWPAIANLHVISDQTSGGIRWLHQRCRESLIRAPAARTRSAEGLAIAFWSLSDIMPGRLRSIEATATMYPEGANPAFEYNRTLRVFIDLKVQNCLHLDRLTIVLNNATPSSSLRTIINRLPCPTELASALLVIGGPLCSYVVKVRNFYGGDLRADGADLIGETYTACIRAEVQRLLLKDDPVRGWRKLCRNAKAVRTTKPMDAIEADVVLVQHS
jgi:hypothetical protein